MEGVMYAREYCPAFALAPIPAEQAMVNGLGSCSTWYSWKSLLESVRTKIKTVQYMVQLEVTVGKCENKDKDCAVHGTVGSHCWKV